jgi:hypothetical protein
VLHIELLLRPGGVFEIRIDVNDVVTDLAHDGTSADSGTQRTRVPAMAEGLGRPRVVVWVNAVRGCARRQRTDG